MKSDGVVIVGAGQAGFQVAASLRMEGYEGSIALIGDEFGELQFDAFEIQIQFRQQPPQDWFLPIAAHPRQVSQ